MQVLAVVNQKGGVGKTTIAANLAAIAAIDGNARILAIDADPQAALTRQLLDRETERGTVLGLGDVLRQEQTINDVIVRSTSAPVDLVPASRSLAAAEIGLVAATRREERLARALVGVEGYDLLIIDGPPNLGLLTVNAIAACDRVLVPVSAEDEGAVRGVGELLLTIAEVYGDQDPPPVSAVLTKWDRSRETADAVEHALRDFEDRIEVLRAAAPARALNHKGPILRTPASLLPAKGSSEADVRKSYKRIARELGLLEVTA
jgi:chromosome partitioning protein